MEVNKQVTTFRRSRNEIAYRVLMMTLLKVSNKRAGKLKNSEKEADNFG